MSSQTATVGGGVVSAGVSGNCLSRAIKSTADQSLHFFVGLGVLFALWGVGIYIVTLNPAMSQFVDFGPLPALKSLPEMWENGIIPKALSSTGYRLGAGLGLAIAIGIPLGILMGRIRWFQRLTNVPFQFLRMISPLSWEPIAVVVFAGWEQAIIFLIAIASVWPVAFATASGLAKVDPAWFKVARNLGAKPWQMVTRIIMPAITFDILTGGTGRRMDRDHPGGVPRGDLRFRLCHRRCARRSGIRAPHGAGAGDRRRRLRAGQHLRAAHQAFQLASRLIGSTVADIDPNMNFHKVR
ncbi:ABC transporter permease [uncultured Thiobacillus sp.]|uniref:ABC transporter permease n=1 Tax=uncultured Thiobacillus sp. TaxID=189996 RepID=UPI002603C5CB|nr:ABC transporter permease subunit [uncultured Thiobacillus sp.]